jgi:hypothetical protein
MVAVDNVGNSQLLLHAELLLHSYILYVCVCFCFQGSENSLFHSFHSFKLISHFSCVYSTLLLIFGTPLFSFDGPTFLLFLVEFFIFTSSRFLLFLGDTEMDMDQACLVL